LLKAHRIVAGALNLSFAVQPDPVLHSPLGDAKYLGRDECHLAGFGQLDGFRRGAGLGQMALLNFESVEILKIARFRQK
jgi:hypothetical protein